MECYNVIGSNDFTGNNLLQPDSYYYQSYYRQPTFNADGLMSSADTSVFPFTSPYDDYTTPEVPSYGMLPSLLHPTSGYIDDKRRAANCENSRFHHPFPYVSMSPPAARTDQFPAFPDAYTPSISSSVDQIVAARPSDTELCSDDRQQFECPPATDYQSKVENHVSSDTCDVISCRNNNRGPHNMADYSPVSSARTDAVQQANALPACASVNVKTDISSCSTHHIQDAKTSVTCKVTSNGQ